VSSGVLNRLPIGRFAAVVRGCRPRTRENSQPSRVDDVGIPARSEEVSRRAQRRGELKKIKRTRTLYAGLRHVPLVFAGESIRAGLYSSVSSASSTVSWQSILSGVHTLSRRNRPITDCTFGCSIPPGKTQDSCRLSSARERGSPLAGKAADFTRDVVSDDSGGAVVNFRLSKGDFRASKPPTS